MLGLAFQEAHRSQRLGLRLQQQQGQQHAGHGASTAAAPPNKGAPPLTQQQQQPQQQQPQTQTPGGGQGQHKRTRRRRRQKKKGGGSSETDDNPSPASSVGSSNNNNNRKKQHGDAPMTKKDLYFCLRCGMVRVGGAGGAGGGVGDDTAEENATAVVGRVTIVNWDGDVVMDSFVKVPHGAPVLDCRTETTGITVEALHSSQALPFAEARARVETLTKGKILIGHGLEVDLAALGLMHPWCDVRDTANYAPYMREISGGGDCYGGGAAADAPLMLVPRDLQGLVETVLKRRSTTATVVGPVQEAACIIDLYKAARNEWEAELIKLIQQKERQRELVLRMRSSGDNRGGGDRHHHQRGPPPAPHLSAIREDVVVASGSRQQQDDGLLGGKRGRSASLQNYQGRGDVSTIGSTVATVPFTEDECSEASSYAAPFPPTAAAPAPLPPGFGSSRDAADGSPQIENLREVLGRQESLEENPSPPAAGYMHPATWSAPPPPPSSSGDAASETSSLTSARMDSSWSLDDNHSSGGSELVGGSISNVWAAAPVASFPSDVRRPWPPSERSSSVFNSEPLSLTEEELLGPQLLADLNDALPPSDDDDNSTAKKLPAGGHPTVRKQSWFLRRLSANAPQRNSPSADDDASAGTAATSTSFFGHAY